MQIDCPHCSRKTTLLAPQAIEAEDPGNHHNDATHQEAGMQSGANSLAPPDEGRNAGRSKVWIAATVCVLVAGAVGFLILRKRSSEQLPAASSAPTTTVTGRRNPGASPAPETKDTGSAKAAKSPEDLKVGAIHLEKAKGNSLVYAVGVMQNTSDLQRFGVNIELELSDAGGKKVGTARDYRNVIEPRQEWRFRALVLDSKAVSARVAQIREEE